MNARVLVGLLLALAAVSAPAQTAPIAGIDYEEIKSPPQATVERGIEVIEYFWYRCPHCFALEPLLEPWVARLPAGVKLRRIPAVLGKEWLIDARVFYALEQVGELERVHAALLDAIHREGGRRLDRDPYARWVADWLARHGVDRERYVAAFESASVREKAMQAAELSRRLQLEATPTFQVAGRYLVSPPPGERRRILEITDYLVSRVQAESFARR